MFKCSEVLIAKRHFAKTKSVLIFNQLVEEPTSTYSSSPSVGSQLSPEVPMEALEENPPLPVCIPDAECQVKRQELPSEPSSQRNQ